MPRGLEPDDDRPPTSSSRRRPAGLGVGLPINVRDSTVRDSLMTLTTLYPLVAAVVSLWTQQCHGEQVKQPPSGYWLRV